MTKYAPFWVFLSSDNWWYLWYYFGDNFGGNFIEYYIYVFVNKYSCNDVRGFERIKHLVKVAKELQAANNGVSHSEIINEFLVWNATKNGGKGKHLLRRICSQLYARKTLQNGGIGGSYEGVQFNQRLFLPATNGPKYLVWRNVFYVEAITKGTPSPQEIDTAMLKTICAQEMKKQTHQQMRDAWRL